jgi:nucleoside-diphosphate-sugar epimerase
VVNYRRKSVLITGGTGFIGGRLAERLVVEHDALVRILVRNWSRAVWASRLPVELVPGSMEDAASLENAVKGCSIVFHCASGGSTDDEYFRTNVTGTQNALEAALGAGVERFVFVSSIAVHGPQPPDSADETDAYRSWGRGYSDSKIEAEQLVLKYGRDRGLPVSIVRPTFVWGPRSDLFTIRQLRAMRAGTFRLVDQGGGSCHAVYVEHLIDLLLAVGLHPNAIGEAFLAVDGFDLTWRDFFMTYAAWLGISSLPSVSSRAWGVRLGGRALEWLNSRLVAWQGQPAPIWRRVCRRTARMIRSALERRGAMSPWDLAKFARRGRLNSSKARWLLGHTSALTFDEAMRQTEVWVRDQLGVELGLGEELQQSSTDTDSITRSDDIPYAGHFAHLR